MHKLACQAALAACLRSVAKLHCTCVLMCCCRCRSCGVDVVYCTESCGDEVAVGTAVEQGGRSDAVHRHW